MSFVRHFCSYSSNKPQNGQISLRHDLWYLCTELEEIWVCDIFAHKILINRKTVKSAKNTISDFSAQNSRRYEFCDIFDHTVVKSRKTVKSAKNTIFFTCEQN